MAFESPNNNCHIKGNGNLRKTQKKITTTKNKQEMQPPTLTNFRGMNAHLRIDSDRVYSAN